LLTPIRRALLVALLALAALAAVCGSAGAQPGPDDDPNYNDPMWRYANPAAVSAADTSAKPELVAQDGANDSTQAALPADYGEVPPVEPGREPQPDWLEQEQAAGGR
jgi:hypothetical protein